MAELRKVSDTTKRTVFGVMIVILVMVLTATITYYVSSNRYLDELDEQNQQIKDLQNIIRKNNGLPELKEVE